MEKHTKTERLMQPTIEKMLAATQILRRPKTDNQINTCSSVHLDWKIFWGSVVSRGQLLTKYWLFVPAKIGLRSVLRETYPLREDFGMETETI